MPLVFLIVIGGVGGYFAHEHGLAPYRATSSLALEDMQTFKRAESLLRSSVVLERFAKARDLQNDSAIVSFVRQLSLGQNQPVSLAAIYPVTRTDVKDLPDAVSRDLFKEVKFRPAIEVSVANVDAREAIRIHSIVRDYARDTLLRSTLMDMLQLTRVDALSQDARLTSQMSEDRQKLESLTRQIKEMVGIRERYEETPSGKAQDSAALNREIIQVPTSETRFLSPERQLVGLETQKAHISEQIRLSAERQVYAKATERYASALIEDIAGQPDMVKLLETEIDRLKPLKISTADAADQLPTEEARDRLRAQLIVLQGTYVTLAATSAEPLVYRTGPRLSAAIGGGAILGFAAWFILLRLSQGLAPGRKDPDVAADNRNIRPIDAPPRTSLANMRLPDRES